LEKVSDNLYTEMMIKSFRYNLVSFYWNVKEQNVMKSGITPDIVVNSDSDYLKEVEKLLKSKR